MKLKLFHYQFSRSKSWLKRIHREDLLTVDIRKCSFKFRVCSDHFSEHRFGSTGSQVKGRRLRKFAFPDIVPGCSSEIGECESYRSILNIYRVDTFYFIIVTLFAGYEHPPLPCEPMSADLSPSMSKCKLIFMYKFNVNVSMKNLYLCLVCCSKQGSFRYWRRPTWDTLYSPNE